PKMNQFVLQKHRIQSIDILRGLIMLIMTLDHTRDFFHFQGPQYNPTNMATTTVLLFFTRWITHYCAPVFVFLSGVSACLAGQRRTKAN
ncbi:MAG: heparan-alpha-glucosaminide N-acetyltransferase domain-containing protein, partial [Mucilaginibacter sp.]